MATKSTPSPVTRSTILTGLLQIVADRGIDQASVREVAAAADVAIGTVQHYFPTKNLMLAAAYTEAIRRIRQRLRRIEFGDDLRHNLFTAMRELLPLDAQRTQEVRIHVAFAARAATTPELSAIEQDLLAEVYSELAEIISSSWGGHHNEAECLTVARSVLAIADGIALHAVSTATLLDPDQQTSTLRYAIDAIVGE